MNTFAACAFREVYSKQKSENRLLQIVDIIDWKPIREILEVMYKNKSEKGGWPNWGVLIKFRILILEEWYGLSDLEVVRQIADRVSIMGFLGFPERVPDSSMVWLFKERMIETGTYDRVWDEFRRQLNSNGLEVKRERSRMLHSSNLIPGHQKNFAVIKLKLAKAKMAHGPRRVMSFIFGINFILKYI